MHDLDGIIRIEIKDKKINIILNNEIKEEKEDEDSISSNDIKDNKKNNIKETKENFSNKKKYRKR